MWPMSSEGCIEKWPQYMCHVYTRVKCRDLNIHPKNPLKISSGNIINEVQSCVSRQLRSVQECTVYTLLFVQIAIDKKMS